MHGGSGTPRDARLAQFLDQVHVVDLAVAEAPLLALAVVVIDQLMRGRVVNLETAAPDRADEFFGVELATTILVPGLERLAQDTRDRAACAEHRGPSRRRRPDDHVDSRGITTTASLSREDAIDATAVPRTRRDGPRGPKQLKFEKETTLMEVRRTPRRHHFLCINSPNLASATAWARNSAMTPKRTMCTCSPNSLISSPSPNKCFESSSSISSLKIVNISNPINPSSVSSE